MNQGNLILHQTETERRRHGKAAAQENLSSVFQKMGGGFYIFSWRQYHLDPAVKAKEVVISHVCLEEIGGQEHLSRTREASGLIMSSLGEKKRTR